VKDGGRTRLQELLLEDYAAINELKFNENYNGWNGTGHVS
jgi:hypothetical protein